jgi:peptidoglycan/LPS O-acetylase OafA/YrhL
MLPGSFEPLGVGCALAVFSFREGKANQFGWATQALRQQFGWLALGSLGVAIVLWAIFGSHNVIRFFTNGALMAVVYGWVVLSAAIGFGGIVGRVLENRVAVYIGRISYGIYVTHNFMPSVVEALFGPLPKIVAAPIVLGLTFGVCALSYRFYEAPIRRLGDRLRSPRRATAGTLPREEVV